MGIKQLIGEVLIKTKKSEHNMVRLNAVTSDYIAKTLKAGTASFRFDNSLNKQNKSLINVSKNADKTGRSFMGMGFAMLFGGMAIKKAFGGALKELFNNYKEVMGETSAFNQLTNQLSGSWTFLKFTIMDALMQTGLFQSIIGFMVKLINSISQFTAKHKGITQMIVIFMAFMVVLGTIAMVAGQASLAVIGFGMASKASLISFGIILAQILGILLVVSAAIIIIMNIWNSEAPKGIKIMATVVVVLLAIAAVVAILGFGFTALWILLAAGVVIVVAAFVAFFDTIKVGFELMATNLAAFWSRTQWKLINGLIKLTEAYNRSWLGKKAKIDTSGMEEMVTQLQIAEGILENQAFNLKDKLKTTFKADVQGIKDLFGVDELQGKLDNFDNPFIEEQTKQTNYTAELVELEKEKKRLDEEQLFETVSQTTEIKSLNFSMKDMAAKFGGSNIDVNNIISTTQG